MAEEFENWACAELDSLGLPDGSVIIQYLQPLESPIEVEDLLNSMLDTKQPEHRNFIKEFLKRQAESKVDKRFYRKSDLANETLPVQTKKKGKNNGNQATNGNGGGAKEKDKKPIRKSPVNDKENESKGPSPLNDKSDSLQSGQNQSKKKGKEAEKRQVSPPEAAAATKVSSTQPEKTQGKKKTKFVNLYSSDGVSNDVVKLSGRHVCECLASKHKLINNCLSCGRIVCEQEGSGPCFFCGNMVQSKAEREGNVVCKPSNEKSSKSKNLSVKDIAADIQKAVDHKNKLLDYDRTSEKRTKVLDDQSDYYDSNSRWISKDAREKLQAKEKEMKLKKYERSTKKITIDLLGRKIITDEENDAGIYDPDDPVVQELLGSQVTDLFATCERTQQLPPTALERPVYIDTGNKNEKNLYSDKVLAEKPSNSMSRLQDGLLQEMSDQGKCISMHQPYATLLTTGIKIHEGRTWYSAHRGRLWIASAAKVPEKEEIDRVEEFYKLRNTSGNLVFPHHYPAGCLLGCVDVVDVLPQEEYRLQYPDGESECPFVFVCKNPQEMIFKFPIKGQHKIYEMESKIHQAAKKALK